MNDRLADKVIIVTGSAQGIGRAYAKGVAEQGAGVIVADIKEDGAQTVAEEINGAGGRATALRVDIADEASIAEMVAKATAAYGGIDGLVNNAAIYEGLERLDPLDIPIEDWDRVLTVNLRGTFSCTRLVVPSLRERGGGAIVNQASIGAWIGGALMHYSVAKAGVIAMTRLFAQTLGPDRIRVNAVAPGVINTRATLDHLPKEVESAMIQTQAIRRIGTPEDLVGAVVFLCSDEAAFVTGQTLIVDGGFLKI
jgi:NAD(P)-dependent dehydrogenase (short-subunit alcohol dehydrogenase family)